MLFILGIAFSLSLGFAMGAILQEPQQVLEENYWEYIDPVTGVHAYSRSDTESQSVYIQNRYSDLPAYWLEINIGHKFVFNVTMANTNEYGTFLPISFPEGYEIYFRTNLTDFESNVRINWGGFDGGINYTSFQNSRFDGYFGNGNEEYELIFITNNSINLEWTLLNANLDIVDVINESQTKTYNQELWIFANDTDDIQWWIFENEIYCQKYMSCYNL